jgi:hypothetical protein
LDRTATQATASVLLRRPLTQGYKDFQFLMQDKRLEPLRSHPEFQKLLKDLQISAHG